jgi:photosystem II stability/assembly factor-like uncharacterized protein
LVLAGCSTGHLGPTVFRSADGGRTWTEASVPPAFRSGEPLARSLKAAFWLTPGLASQPGGWFLGGSPQGMFRSEDDGDTWVTVDGWNDHPMWTTWCEWPEQNTPDGSMLHSISLDPRDANHMYLGLSSGGVFESVDGGADWHPLNKGSVHPMLSHSELEFGHDPHCLRLHPLRPDRLYQQNHCGMYRLDRDSTSPDIWVRIGNNMPAEVGDIGFPIELHPRNPDTAWVFPMDGSDVWPRTSPDGRPAVYRTTDAGQSWLRQDKGLPSQGWLTVKRQAMTTDDHDPVGVYFGTTSGEVWASFTEGDSWSCLVAQLPEIYSVHVTSS